jgi:pimeloyl-ACP methyl ester carboxylesterase
MPAVLVHGVPETSELWDDLIPLLGRDDVIALRLPGFGTPRPDGFGATKEEYVDWLVDELERINADDGPVDLVGHDWGGGFTVRLVSIRPDLVRSWASDAAGLGDIEFEWHDFAKIWQTPDEGERFWRDQLATPVEERAGVFELFGLARDAAVKLSGMVDETMAGCILPLYRSAMTVGQQWAPDFHDIPKPGLVLAAEEDAFLALDRARTGAERAGARLEVMPGLGHWWMLQDPAPAAALLKDFWASC